MDLDRLMTWMNPLVASLLRSPFHWILSRGLMLLTVTGRRTGRRYTIPVGYQRDGEHLVVLVSKASRKQWWRNYEDPAPVEVHVAGVRQRGRAFLVPTESAEFRHQVELTLKRLPWLARQFGVSYDRATGLRDEQIAHIRGEVRMVQIDLGSSPAGEPHYSRAGAAAVVVRPR